MKIYSKLLYFFKIFLFYALILSLFNCNMNSEKKENKINKVEFKINKKNGVIFTND
jgi:hypothetical protein